MKNQLIALTMVLILIIVGFNGCIEENNKKKNVTNESLSGKVTVTTNKSEYEQNETINISLYNGLNISIYSSIAGYPYEYFIEQVEQKTSEGWLVLQPFSILVFYAFRGELKPGKSVSFEWEPLVWNNATNNYSKLEFGVYRIKTGYNLSENNTWETVYSNEFTIKPSLDFDISVNNSCIIGEPIIVNATLTNMGSEPVDILIMGPEVGTLDFFITTPDGKNLHYIGSIVFYCPSIALLPTEQIFIEMDLTDDNYPFGETLDPYNFTVLGEYTIQGGYVSGNVSIGNLKSSIHTFTIIDHSEPTMNFSKSECGVFAFDESDIGINETTWIDDTTLNVKANVLINCGEEIINGSYLLVDDIITLYYNSPECVEECMDCMCGVVLYYNFTNLDKKDYQFQLERIV